MKNISNFRQDTSKLYQKKATKSGLHQTFANHLFASVRKEVFF